MSESKKPNVYVPQGMLRAVLSEVRDNFHDKMIAESALYDALRWQKENWSTAPNAERMPEPWYTRSLKEWNKFTAQWSELSDISFVDILIFCGNRLYERYDAPKPEVSEEIKDLILPDIESGFFKPEVLNERLREAFRRGQESKK
jgi:hypothetical protein